MLINWIALVALGFYGALVALFGVCAADRVSIDFLVKYFTAAVLMLAPTLLFTFLTFEFQRTFKSWASRKFTNNTCPSPICVDGAALLCDAHNFYSTNLDRWATSELSELRRIFCRPASSADSECKGGPLTMPVNWTTSQTLETAVGNLLPAGGVVYVASDVEVTLRP